MRKSEKAHKAAEARVKEAAVRREEAEEGARQLEVSTVDL